MSKRLLPQARLLVLALAGILMMGALSGCYVYGRGHVGFVEVGMAPPGLPRRGRRRHPGPGLPLGAGVLGLARPRVGLGGRRLGAPAARSRHLGWPRATSATATTGATTTATGADLLPPLVDPRTGTGAHRSRSPAFR